MNTTLTAPMRHKIKEMYPDIEIIVEDQWIQLCKQFSYAVDPYFRQLIKINANVAIEYFEAHFIQKHLIVEQEDPNAELVPLLVYSNYAKGIVRLDVSSSSSALELLEILKTLLRVPEEVDNYDEQVKTVVDPV